jgi:hypothetical protein
MWHPLRGSAHTRVAQSRHRTRQGTRSPVGLNPRATYTCHKTCKIQRVCGIRHAKYVSRTSGWESSSSRLLPLRPSRTYREQRSQRYVRAARGTGECHLGDGGCEGGCEAHELRDWIDKLWCNPREGDRWLERAVSLLSAQGDGLTWWWWCP